VIILNAFWYTLILKGLQKMLIEKGVLKKPNDYEEDDRLNAYSAEEKKVE